MTENTRDLSHSIEKSKNEVTILFTDIVNSTQFWDKYGDTAGRLMLDKHNTLLFPVVETFHGTIIKTIGDSIMASFKSPKDGVEAAIAMQQQLRLYRHKNKNFKIHIRIGVHTGKAIVESNDVYGDTVNVAARVEGAAGSDEILVSQLTARKLPSRRSRYGLTKQRHFVPKGKRRRLSVWVCDWRSLKNLTDAVRPSNIIPPNRRQQIELVLYLVVALVTVYLFYHRFIRYLLGDFEFFAKYVIIPHPVVTVLLILALIGAIFLSVRALRKLYRPPIVLFRLLKGGFGFGVLFFAALFLFQLIDLDYKPYWAAPFYRTRHHFVEIVSKRASILREPLRKSSVIGESHQGDIYILNKLIKRKRLTFAKVIVRHDTLSHGYILERLPPRIGVPPIDQFKRKDATVRYYHLYALLLGLLGFCYGAWSFHLRPL